MNILTTNKNRLVTFLLTLLVISFALEPAIPTSAQTDSLTFPETGKVVKGRFYEYWLNHGGLAQLGYPISAELREQSESDNKFYTVQYFERAVLELHPENQPPNDVELQLLGKFRYEQKYPNGAPGQKRSPDLNRICKWPNNAITTCLGGDFLEYWREHGELAQQGYPISEEFQERSDLNGTSYLVQYFERAVLEYHPEITTTEKVLLSQLGTFRYQERNPQIVPIEISAGDWPLVIRGQPQADNSLTGNLRLTAPYGPIERFTFLPSDLRITNPDDCINAASDPSLAPQTATPQPSLVPQTATPSSESTLDQETVTQTVLPDLSPTSDPSPTPQPSPTPEPSPTLLIDPATGGIIGRQHIKLPNNPSLLENAPVDFPVQVIGVTHPGCYKGSIALLIPTQPAGEASTIPLYVHVIARVQLSTIDGTNQINMNLVHTIKLSDGLFDGFFGSLDKGLSEVLLPASARAPQRVLQLDNATMAPITVTNVAIILNGETTGSQLLQDIGPSSAFTVASGAITLPANQVVTLPINLTLDNMPPDHYSGNIFLTVQGANERTKLPINLNVRVGPLFPILALLLGLILGLMYKVVQERSKDKAVALSNYPPLVARVDTAKYLAAEDKDKAAINAMVAEVRENINRNKVKTARTQIADIERRMDILEEIYDKEQVLESLRTVKSRPSAGTDEITKALTQIDTIRKYVHNRQDVAAQNMLSYLNHIVEPILYAGTTISAHTKSKPKQNQWERFLTDLREKVVEPIWSAINSLVFWVLKRITGFALTLGLLAVGLNSLYVEKSATFGVNPLTDYLGLIVWALSANVINRTLTNLLGDASPTDSKAPIPEKK